MKSTRDLTKRCYLSPYLLLLARNLKCSFCLKRCIECCLWSGFFSFFKWQKILTVTRFKKKKKGYKCHTATKSYVLPQKSPFGCPQLIWKCIHFWMSVSLWNGMWFSGPEHDLLKINSVVPTRFKKKKKVPSKPVSPTDPEIASHVYYYHVILGYMKKVSRTYSQNGAESLPFCFEATISGF